ncbi:MAG: Rne/Rng family ribonuclease [Clostridia bacterium]|nr:Rne/Rng family ribonuclease [Clostridia bacterium]
MKKEWFFDRYCGQQFAALVEDGKLAEFSAEKESCGDIVGNIYKGRVTNVLSGMNAAFISCGLAKNCYLSMEETYTDYTKYDGTPVETNAKPLNLKVGDELIVQVSKPPRGNKGAKVTTHLSFVGKHIIYLPKTDFLGISRKITDEREREKLLKIADKMRGASKNEGFIVRTQAPFATQKQLKTEADYLKKLYAQMLKTAADAPVGAVLYEDEELPVRIMRDSFGDELVAIRVGDAELYQRLHALIKLRGDVPERKLVKYTGERSMFKEYGIMSHIYDAARPTVSLDNGGYLVIDHTEAMTVIDVNTGSYVGETSLEETVFAVNMEAAREIARQVRLRNIGGIVVVDFIDMTKEEHKLAVTEELTKRLSQDKAKCNVLPMSELCLTQFTRKRVGNEAFSYLVKPCAHCGGTGEVHDDIFVVMQIRSAILDCFADGYTSALVECNEGIMRKILSEGMFSIEVKTRWRDKRVYFVPHKTYKEQFFTVRGDTATVLHLPDKAQILY